MKPVKFKEVNVTYAENQPEYQPLPGFKNASPEGEFVFCMGMTLRERIKVLFTGKIWVTLLTFNNPLTPSFHSVDKKDVLQ
jgi:hypothetical protein